jgi:hypothetical protein
LNVHKHHAFNTIIFSDTILVYNAIDPRIEYDHSYLVMYLCEFAQDLMHRLVGRDIFFRALLMKGDFNHYKLNDIHCYFGQALIDAYRREKTIKSVGLFIDKSCLDKNRFFSTSQYDDQASFVFLTKNLGEVEYTYGGLLPLPDIIAIDTELYWFLGPELLMLQDVYNHSLSHPVDEVREKYSTAWQLYKRQYPKTLSILEKNGFDLTSINSNFDWSKLLLRYPEDYSWAAAKKDVIPPNQ